MEQAMKTNLDIGRILLLGLCSLVGGCSLDAGDTQPDTQPEDTGTTAAAWTAAYPWVDATEVCKLPENPYTDIGIDHTTPRIILARSDGYVEYRRVNSTCSLVRRYSVGWDRLKWIDNNWKLLAASNAAKQINVGAQCSGLTNCSFTGAAAFPAGVNYVHWIAGYPANNGSSTTDMTIYISVNKPAGNKVIRKGTFSTANPGVINWDPAEYGNTMYRTALVAARPENLNGGAPALFQVVDYYTSMFVWRGLDNLGGEIGEATFASWGYTEHAYRDPDNCADRFAPQGLDFDEANWLFYGLDRYYGNGPSTWCPGGSGNTAWVVTTLGSSYIHP
jgi:hypothetical protein